MEYAIVLRRCVITPIGTRTYLTSVRRTNVLKLKRIFLQQYCAPDVCKFQQSTHQDHGGRLSNEVRYTT